MKGVKSEAIQNVYTQRGRSLTTSIKWNLNPFLFLLQLAKFKKKKFLKSWTSSVNDPILIEVENISF